MKNGHTFRRERRFDRRHTWQRDIYEATGTSLIEYTMLAPSSWRTAYKRVGVSTELPRDLIAKMLRDEGVPEDRIRAVHAPIGLDLGGRTPSEIALSVLSEMSMERHGGTGRALRLDEAIHDRAAAKS